MSVTIDNNAKAVIRAAEEIIATKRCNKCGQDLLLESFPLDKSAPGGRRAGCRECKNATMRELRARRKSTFVEKLVDSSLALGKERMLNEVVHAISERDIAEEANRLALIQLVKNHRSEFDMLTNRAKVTVRFSPRREK